jgi:hypothetical protein
MNFQFIERFTWVFLFELLADSELKRGQANAVRRFSGAMEKVE